MSDISAVKRLVEERCAEIRSIKDLARFTNYSAETIRRDFVRLEHVTLSEYISRARVEKAKRLLETTDMACQEISYEVGFSRADVGARTFKRFTGKAMREYRDFFAPRDIAGAERPSFKSSPVIIPLKSTAKVNR